MAENKTKETKTSVAAFVAGITDTRRRDDVRALIGIMQKATKAEPKMWGPSIIGFGSRRLKYDSGRELDWLLVGLSPRKQNLTLYLGLGGCDPEAGLMKKLGKYKMGRGCLYINSLEDVDVKTLTALVGESVKRVAKA